MESVTELPGAPLIDFHRLLEIGIERRDQNPLRGLDHIENIAHLENKPGFDYVIDTILDEVEPLNGKLRGLERTRDR